MSDFTNEITVAESEFETESQSEKANRASIDDVDLSVLLGFAEAQCEDEPDLIVELIDLYLNDFAQQLSVMKDGVLNADENSLKRAAHTLKGSSANLGVNGVAALCEKIEKTDSSESFQESNDLICRMEETFARVRPIFLAERQGRV